MLIDGRYEPCAPAVAGGMGSVVKCRDKVLQRDVAVKFLAASVEKRRISDEIKALEAVRSPHVVQMYDVVVEPPDNRVGIVQEFIEGQDLAQLASGGIGLDEATRYFYQIACGLADVHGANVIHRDVKPNNMKVDGSGIVKLFDFGLARTLGDAYTRGFRGSVGFSAPELYSYGHVEFTPAVDSYSFGCTALWILRGGSLPAHLVQTPPSPSQGNEFAGLQLHAEIERALCSCLAQTPPDRPTMSTLRDLLRKHLLRDKHRALLTYLSTTSVLNTSSRTLTLTRPNSMDSIRISYTGLAFIVVTVGGEVFVNNARPVVGNELTGSCLITLGLDRDRVFVTFDVSHPEVVL